jgi:hypothetical protein
MIENTLNELIQALRENTAAMQARSTAAPITVATDDATEAISEDTRPTPVATKKPKAGTPSIPAKVVIPNQPEAADHVDVDEVIAEIQSVVKKAMVTGDPEAVKVAWTAVLKGYGIPRIAELRNDPARLVEALGKAKTL